MASPPTESEGDLVTAPPALHPNTITALTGQHISLVPLTHTHIPSLYLNLGGAAHAHIWRYIPDGPYLDLDSFTKGMVRLMESTIFFPFAIMSSNPVHLSNQSENQLPNKQEKGEQKREETAETAVGVITYMNISPSNLCLEIGCVLFTPSLQRTTAATEVIYLLLKWAFEQGGYQRMEWKANNNNEPSKRAAERIGFVSEGVFRKHMVVKGRRRDTRWFSMLDEEWFGVEGGKGCKGALERWLGEENFDEGRQVRRLEEFRGFDEFQADGTRFIE